MAKNYCLLSGSIFGMLGVLLGAFGAHGLENMLSPAMLQRYDTGIEYQFYHALALLFTGLLQQHSSNKWQKWFHGAGLAFITGILLFSGSLYLYALSSSKVFVIFTPIGGLFFIIGWLCLIRIAWQHQAQHNPQR